MGAIVFLLFLVSSVFFFRPEIEILTKDPLKVTKIYVGGLDIDFITSVRKDIAIPLKGQVKDISVSLKGRVIVRVHDKRYRVVCYTASGSGSYGVPINVPLNYVIEKCISRAG